MNTRMTITLSDALNKDMEKMINTKKYSVHTKVQVLRNSFVVYKLLLDELDKGNKIAITDQDNHIIKEIIMGH